MQLNQESMGLTTLQKLAVRFDPLSHSTVFVSGCNFPVGAPSFVDTLEVARIASGNQTLHNLQGSAGLNGVVKRQPVPFILDRAGLWVQGNEPFHKVAPRRRAVGDRKM